MTETTKPRAPALTGIITIKLVKGLVFLGVALIVYALSDNDLSAELRSMLSWLHLNPERRFFVFLAEQVAKITETNALWVAGGTLAYSLLALTEAIGLIFRVTWASWLTIGESAMFIPIEIFELVKKFSVTVLIILVLNIFIYWYLLLNRKRLFHRAHLRLHHQAASS